MGLLFRKRRWGGLLVFIRKLDIRPAMRAQVAVAAPLLKRWNPLLLEPAPAEQPTSGRHSGSWSSMAKQPGTVRDEVSALALCGGGRHLRWLAARELSWIGKCSRIKLALGWEDRRPIMAHIIQLRQIGD